MISRREKMKRQLNAARESVFYAALEVLTDKKLNLSVREVQKIVKTYKEDPLQTVTAAKKVKSTPSTSRPPSRTSKGSPEEEAGSESFNLKSELNDSAVPALDEKPAKLKPKSARKSVDVKEQLHTSAKDKQFKSESTHGDECIDIMSEDTHTSLCQTDEIKSEPQNIDISDEKLDVKPPGKRGRPRKYSKPGEISSVADEASPDSDKATTVPAKKTRTRTSLPDIVDEGLEESLGLKSQDGLYVEETKQTSVKRERRASSVNSLTKKEKDDLAEKFPSSKNVSDRVKAELNGYLKNNKLLVNNKLRHKVQSALLQRKRNNRFGNGIIIDHSQSKIDSFFVKSPPSCDPNSYKSPGKNVSRVLNELSPTRDRMEANNIEKTALLRSTVKVSECQIITRSGNTPNRQSPALSEKSSDGHTVESPSTRSRQRTNSIGLAGVKERLFDGESRRSTRSRESTPESTASSVRSFSRRQQDNGRTRTRSETPLGKDSDSETENCFESKRVKR